MIVYGIYRCNSGIHDVHDCDETLLENYIYLSKEKAKEQCQKMSGKYERYEVKPIRIRE